MPKSAQLESSHRLSTLVVLEWQLGCLLGHALVGPPSLANYIPSLCYPSPSCLCPLPSHPVLCPHTLSFALTPCPLPSHPVLCPHTLSFALTPCPLPSHPVLCPHTLSFTLTPCPLPSSSRHSPLKGPCWWPHTTRLSPLTVIVGIQHGCQGAGARAGTCSVVAGKSVRAMCDGGEGACGGTDGWAGGQ